MEVQGTLINGSIYTQAENVEQGAHQGKVFEDGLMKKLIKWLKLDYKTAKWGLKSRNKPF